MDAHIPGVKIRLKDRTLEEIASIPETRTYKSILTVAPKANLLLPLALAKITKAFFFVSFLTLFVDRSIANRLWDDKLHDDNWLKGSSSIGNDNNERGTLSKVPSSSAVTPDYDIPIVPRHSLNSTEQAKEDMLNGIAQDIFFHPMEFNFYEAGWFDFFSEWASDSQPRYDAARQTRPDLSKFTFFAEDVLDWKHLDCSSYTMGCQGMPSPEMVRKQFPTDRFKARQVIYVLDAFRKLHVEVNTYLNALDEATANVSGYCNAFAKTFFHGKTQGYKKICTGQIIQIVMGVISAIIAIATLGQALYALVPMLGTGISALIASGTAGIIEVGTELSIETGIEVGMEAGLEVAGEISSEAIAAQGVSMPLIRSADISAWAYEVFEETGIGAEVEAETVAAANGFKYVAPYAETVTDSVGGGAGAPSVAGSNVGVVGEGAVADTASSVLDTVSYEDWAWLEIPSDVSDGSIDSLWEAHLKDLLQWRAKRIVFQMYNAGFRPSRMPWLIKRWFSTGRFTRMLQTATLYARGYVSPHIMKPLLANYASVIFRGEFIANLLGRGINVAGTMAARGTEEDDQDSMDEDELLYELLEWTKDALLESLLSATGNSTGVTDIPAFVADEKRKIQGKRDALKRAMDIAMSSFTKSRGDKSPPPKVWGSFAIIEWFPLDALHDGEYSIYDQTSVNSRLLFKKYPKALQLKDENGTTLYSERSEASTLFDEPVYLRTEGNATDVDFDTNVLRLSKLFTMYELDTPRDTLPSVDSAWSLGSRIVWRMQDENGFGMQANDALKFWEDNGNEVHRRVQLLRQSDYQSEHVPLKQPVARVQTEEGTSEPGIRIGVNTALDTLPWASVLGTTNFKGYHSAGFENNYFPELKWKAHPLTRKTSGMEKRDIQSDMDRVARHDIRGKLNGLLAFGLIGPRQGPWKRAGGGAPIPLHQQQSGDGNMFVAQVNEHLFKNDIHHESCGLDHYTGDTTENEKNCHTFLDNVHSQISDEMSKLTRSPNPDLLAFTGRIQLRFSSYASFLEADSLAVDRSGLKDKLQKNLQNSLVSKAYADENCFLYCFTHGSQDFEKHDWCSWDGKCGKAQPPPYTPVRLPTSENEVVMKYLGVDCTAGCYDPIQMRFEKLYGFGPDQGASQYPWSLNEEEINVVSWHAYQHGSKEGFVPGRVDLNPYVHNFKDGSPVLPVCATAFGENAGGSGLLCNCGDMYGSETHNVIAAGNWKMETKNNEYDAINICLDRLAWLAYEQPAAYMINMCRVFYGQFVPPGTGSHQEEHDKGDYGANLVACRQYLEFYEANKMQYFGDPSNQEPFLNDHMCRLWAHWSHARHKHGYHPDFSYVNDMLDDEGCKDYL